MTKKTFATGHWLIVTLLTLVPFIFNGIGIAVVKADHSHSVTVQQAAARPGYETVPANYLIDPSPAQQFARTVPTWKLLVGAVLFALFFVYCWFTEVTVREGSWVIAAVLWLAGTLIIWLTYVTKDYTVQIGAEQFNSLHGLYDGLF